MKTIMHGLLSLAFLAQGAVYAGPVERYMQKMQEERMPLQFTDSIHQETFAQLIDHQNSALGTFAQRYFIDETYGKEANAPVFLYICGESACSKRALNGAIRNYARKHHAKLVALEHRYYGESLPQSTFSTADLSYLTTEAALEDLAYFQQNISQRTNWQGKWVAFGGSYPGSLSAYYRLKHPELVVGALASSAPVMAKEDFIEYDAHVTAVAGPTCANQMRAVVDQVEATLDNDVALQQMKVLFDAADVNDPIDFLYLIADVGAAAIQYGMHDSFCTSLSSHATPLEGYADFANKLYKMMGANAVEMTAQGALSIKPEDYPAGVGMRQWYYQSCKEYGYWQNAHHNPSQSTRSARINLDYHHHICQRLFGFEVPVDTQLINQTYYLPLMSDSASRIFFTNGQNDPWSTLSLAEKNGNAGNINLTYQLIDGAAHCDDLRTPKAEDSEALKTARNTTDELLTLWLKS